MPDTTDAVECYGTAVYRLAYAMTRSRHNADDIFQEVFLRYHRAAPAFASEEHRRAWLLRQKPAGLSLAQAHDPAGGCLRLFGPYRVRSRHGPGTAARKVPVSHSPILL